MVTVDQISPAPWIRLGWTGHFISVNGTSTEDFTADDVIEIIKYAKTPPGWDGETAGIVRIKDGRIAAWEAMWDTTGDGFICDAYGGTADIILAPTVKGAMSRLSQRAKDLLRNYAL